MKQHKQQECTPEQDSSDGDMIDSCSRRAGNCLVHTERVELGFKSPMNASGSRRKRIFKYVIIGSEAYALLSLPALNAFQTKERSKHEITDGISE
ncbi:hypothetical protein TNCV_4403661 [Trichonephila clavipes]|uniref:Uncharacterized protein n=1 Tax=Trichonephila clavipes TaxID=2585209 RepID=A0A8X6S2K7_TRICX|nr:hypothetical protein TNCV_4403661 [Trichonephila clavipes]